MSKQTLPVYSICSLSAEPVSRNELIADRFDHYLDTHQDPGGTVVRPDKPLSEWRIHAPVTPERTNTEQEENW